MMAFIPSGFPVTCILYFLHFPQSLDSLFWSILPQFFVLFAFLFSGILCIISCSSEGFFPQTMSSVRKQPIKAFFSVFISSIWLWFFLRISISLLMLPICFCILSTLSTGILRILIIVVLNSDNAYIPVISGCDNLLCFLCDISFCYAL